MKCFVEKAYSIHSYQPIMQNLLQHCGYSSVFIYLILLNKQLVSIYERVNITQQGTQFIKTVIYFSKLSMSFCQVAQVFFSHNENSVLKIQDGQFISFNKSVLNNSYLHKFGNTLNNLANLHCKIVEQFMDCQAKYICFNFFKLKW